MPPCTTTLFGTATPIPTTAYGGFADEVGGDVAEEEAHGGEAAGYYYEVGFYEAGRDVS